LDAKSIPPEKLMWILIALAVFGLGHGIVIEQVVI